MLSAYGLALADVVEEVQEPCSLQYEAGSYSKLDRRIEELSQRCDQILSKQGFSRSLSRIKSHWKASLFAHLVYHYLLTNMQQNIIVIIITWLCLYSSQISIEVFLHLRYEGTDCALMITAAGHPSNAHSCRSGDFRTAFTKRYCCLHCEWSKITWCILFCFSASTSDIWKSLASPSQIGQSWWMISVCVVLGSLELGQKFSQKQSRNL